MVKGVKLSDEALVIIREGWINRTSRKTIAKQLGLYEGTVKRHYLEPSDQGVKRVKHTMAQIARRNGE